MPEGSSQYIYLQNKRFRALSYNWDILSSYGQGTRLYCLSDFQVAWLLSNTEYMRWATRWENCPCTQAELDALKAEMEYNLMNCLDLQPWQLQAVYDNQQTAFLAEYESLWDGVNPSSVNPDAPDDFFDGDASSDREDALCTALTLWAYSYAVEWSSKASLILGIANAVQELINFMLAVGGNISVRVVADLLNPIQEQFDAIQNTVALDTVICDWKTNLEGVAINASNWASGVNSLVYTSGTNEFYIQQLFAQDSQLLGNFLSFVNALGNGYELAQLGVFICACECTEVTEVWDFTGDDFQPIWFPRPSQAGQMLYVAGSGWRGSAPGGSQLMTTRYSLITEVIVTTTAGACRVVDFGNVILGNCPWSGNHTLVNELLCENTVGAGDTFITEIQVTGCLA